MKSLITAMVVSVSVFAASAGDGDRYLHLRQQAASTDRGTNFTELRSATAENPQYDPYYFASPEHSKLLAVVKNGPPDRVVAACRDLTLTQFISISLHGLCAQRLAQLGHSAEAEGHRFVRDGLLASLKPDAEGTVTVINVEEEYEFTAWKGYEVIGHATLWSEREARRISALHVRDETGDEYYIHFRKHPAYERLQRSMIRDSLERVERQDE
jgi:hypothetical protein